MGYVKRPDFEAIAVHTRDMKRLSVCDGGGLTVEYLDQVVRYARDLERDLLGVGSGRLRAGLGLVRR